MHKLNNLTMPFQTRNIRKFSEQLPITDCSCPIKEYIFSFLFRVEKKSGSVGKKTKIKRSDLNITFTYDHCPN